MTAIIHDIANALVQETNEQETLRENSKSAMEVVNTLSVVVLVGSIAGVFFSFMAVGGFGGFLLGLAAGIIGIAAFDSFQISGNYAKILSEPRIWLSTVHSHSVSENFKRIIRGKFTEAAEGTILFKNLNSCIIRQM